MVGKGEIGSKEPTNSSAGAIASLAVGGTTVRFNVVTAIVLLLGARRLRGWSWLVWRVVGNRKGASGENDGEGEELGEVHVGWLI